MTSCTCDLNEAIVELVVLKHLPRDRVSIHNEFFLLAMVQVESHLTLCDRYNTISNRM